MHERQKLNADLADSSDKAEEVNNEELNESLEANSKHFKYSCHTCGRKFRLKCTLTAHRTVHSNERPYACYLCHRS